jgi:radical SAM superfamily enzyme YgiQ (UPF0313 family)
MKILLVNPAQKTKFMAKTSRSFLVPQQTLAQVAALTPNDDVTIMDELIEDIDFDAPADIVGVTGMTDNAKRAYEVADAFRTRGRTVVMGGAHPTARPKEALLHCDAVVSGEAEGVWEKLVEEARGGKKPQGLYMSPGLPTLDNVPRPRRDLLKQNLYADLWPVQTSRGCPYACDFCSVHKFSGRRFRHRPVRDVIREMDEDCGKRIFIVDDIINGDVKYAMELFTEMAPLNRQWIGQVTVSLGKERELVKAMAKAGCIGVFIGLESVDQETLKNMRKKHNRADRYWEHIGLIRDNGIPVLGAFVFGFDTDDQDVFKRTLEFALETKLDLAQFNIITPLPGTDLYDKWEQEQRLRYDDWWLSRHWSEVLFHPKLLSPDELKRGWVETAVQFYQGWNIGQRVVEAARKKDLAQAAFVGSANWSYRQSVWSLAKDMGLAN